MSNSSLVNYTKISPNSTNPRNQKISKITIHHMAGNLSVEACGNVFAPSSRQASSNYGIDSNGRVGLYVDEANRSWCSANRENDNMAVTIEVANDEIGGNWHVSDKAMSKLIELCVDICKRNGIERLNYTGDKSGNLTMHKWFTSTTCPGPYLESKFPWIAEQVNKQLEQKPVVSNFNVGDAVKLVSGAKYKDGKSIPSWVFDSKLYVREISGKYIVISTLKTGAITGVVDEKYLTKYSNNTATNTPSKPTEPAPTPSYKLGEVVKLVSGAKYTNGKSVPGWVINSKLYVRGIQGDNITISILKSGAITGTVNKKYINDPDSLAVGDKVKIVSGAKYVTGQKVPLWVTVRTLYVRAITGNHITVSTLKTGAITGTVAKKDLKKV